MLRVLRSRPLAHRNFVSSVLLSKNCQWENETVSDIKTELKKLGLSRYALPTLTEVLNLTAGIVQGTRRH